MSRIFERFTRAAATLAVLVPVMLLAVPTNTSAGQGRNRGGGGSGSGGQAVPRGSSSAPAPSPAPATPEAAPAPRSGPVQAKPRETPATGSTTTTQDSGSSIGTRREGGATSTRAVPRSSVARSRPGGTTVVVPGGYYGGFWPWGFGGLGFGGYYGDLYGPYSPWDSGYGYGQSLSASGPDGSLRLKITPRDAQVFVDGFYAGIVDEFDGVFQRLHAQAGPHRIEVRAAGYETLTFDVEIRPDQTIKYEGELQKIQ